jgi:predicted site-specific integrase-resolvase
MVLYGKDYLTPSEASRLTHCDVSTLRHWANKGELKVRKSPGGKRFYYVPDLRRLFHLPEPAQEEEEIEDQVKEEKKREVVGYARVSSNKQRPDLDRQIEYIRDSYPDIRIISDVGSGLNYKRKGLKRLLDIVSTGNVKTVVVTYSDRLCRYGLELLEWILDQNDTELLVLCEESHLPGDEGEGELSRDVLDVCNFFVAQYNGRKSGKYRRERAQKVRVDARKSGEPSEPRGTGKGNEDAPDSSSTLEESENED